jgi:hypothetical protein
VRRITLCACSCTSEICDVLVDLLVSTASVSSLVSLTVDRGGGSADGGHPVFTFTDQDLMALSEVGVRLRVLRVPREPVTT